MQILFKNAMVLTMENDTILRDALVAVDGDKLAYVGPERVEWMDRPYDRIVDAAGCLIMPGMVNTHTHLAMTLLRGYGGGLPLKAWLEEKIWPVEERFQQEDYYVGTQMAVAEMLLTGTTCFLDMYMGMEQTAEVLRETGMRGVLSRGMTASSVKELEPKLAENVKLFEDWHGKENGRIQVFLGPHGEYTNTRDTLRACAEAARQLGCGLNIHVAETAGERAGCLERHGVSPVALLEQVGALEGRAVAAHCVYVDENDIRILAGHGVGVAHNPSSNMKLASGFAPVSEMLAQGVRVGLGTDGTASNDRLDMLREANLASLLAKGHTGDPTRLNAFETLRMATLGGAEALGLEERIGSLVAGKQADLVMLDVTGPGYQPQHELINHLVYSSDSRDIKLTMVDGAVLMERGRLTTMDLHEVSRRFTDRARRLFDKA